MVNKRADSQCYRAMASIRSLIEEQSRILMTIAQAKTMVDLRAVEGAIVNLNELIEDTEEIVGISVKKAQEIVGQENFAGADDIEKNFGFRPQRIPRIPFSSKLLERAKDLGMFLSLHVDKDQNGNPLTSNRMKILTARQNRDILGMGTIQDKRKEELFSMSVTPALEWVLMTKRPLKILQENNTNEWITKQAEGIAKFLQELFQDQLPPVYQAMVDEIAEEKQFGTYQGRWDDVGGYYNLAINWQLRPSFAEGLYDWITFFRYQNPGILGISITTKNLDKGKELITLFGSTLMVPRNNASGQRECMLGEIVIHDPINDSPPTIIIRGSK